MALQGSLTHYDPTNRRMTDHETRIDRKAMIEPIEILASRAPVPRNPRLERQQRHALNTGEHPHEVAGGIAVDRGDTEPTVSPYDRRDAVQRRRTEHRIPEALH